MVKNWGTSYFESRINDLFTDSLIRNQNRMYNHELTMNLAHENNEFRDRI